MTSINALRAASRSRDWILGSPKSNSDSLPTSKSPTLQRSPINENENLLNSDTQDELEALRRCLRYLILDIKGCMAWCFFLGLAILIPLGSCVSRHSVSDISVQVGLTAAAFPAFWSVRTLLCRHGLNQAMFLDELRTESPKVQSQLVEKIRSEYKVFYILIAIFTLLDLAYKMYWLFWVLPDAKDCSAHWCDTSFTWLLLSLAELISFMYRIAIVFVCALLLQIHCVLQGLRMKDFMETFSEDVNLMSVYKEQKSIETHLRAISIAHEFFILSLLIVATGSLIWSAILVTRPATEENLPHIIEPLLCTMFLVVSLIVCLTSAVQMTNKAEAIKDHVLCWHARVSLTTDLAGNSIPLKEESVSGTSDKSVDTYDDDQLQGLNHMMRSTEKMLSAKLIYDKRIAILTYMEAYKGGITLYGFVLNRTWLQALCVFQYSLISWVLGKFFHIQ